MERIPERIDSKFRYVLLASHRAEQMMRGAQPKLGPQAGKITRIAMQEVIGDIVKWDYGPEPVVEEALEEEMEAVETEEIEG